VNAGSGILVAFSWHCRESVDGSLAKATIVVYSPWPEMSMNASTHTLEPKTVQAVTALPCASRRIAVLASTVRRFDASVALPGRRAR
jgi:hypothetical protein